VDIEDSLLGCFIAPQKIEICAILDSHVSDIKEEIRFKGTSSLCYSGSGIKDALPPWLLC
jgi:hypothetical protein